MRNFILYLMLVLNCLAFTAAGGELIWSDEFDGPVLDSDKWTFDTGTGNWGWGNGELQNYTARSENARIESGNLIIEARRESYNGSAFTSARIKSIGRMGFTYGTLEARIKIPDLANGLWPAFWLLGDNIGTKAWPACGEIDVLEMGMKEAIVAGTQNRRTNSGVFWDHLGSLANYALQKEHSLDLHNDYHVYKLQWTPETISTYIDGSRVYEIAIAAQPGGSMEEFHRPMHLLLNLAVGGQNFVNITDPAAITAPMPARMYIDWVRLYDNGHTVLRGNETQQRGNFGVYTETTPVDGKVTFGTDANLYIWNNMTATTAPAYEGTQVWSFNTAANVWWGMGVACTVDRNMKRYSDGCLHLNMKMASTQSFRIGIKSTAAGESWLTVKDGAEQFGLVRDGNWHEMLIPLNRFDNIDFNTINQLFMIASDGGPASNIAIDNVYWVESGTRPTPANGNYGVFTETAAHKNAGEFISGTTGSFYIWENTLTGISKSPREGSDSLSFKSAAGLNWFGAAFTATVKLDLSAYRYQQSYLHFALKTSSAVPFQIGMKSGNVKDIGQKWIVFAPGQDPYGFVRDGRWHEINIPMSDFAGVDLSQVSQVFELLGTSGPISAVEIDDIYFGGGGMPLRELTGDIVSDGRVELNDLEVILGQWLNSNCSLADDHCQGADLNYDGQIDLADLSQLATHWLYSL